MGVFSKIEGKLDDAVEGVASSMFKSPIEPAQIAKKAEKLMHREKLVGAGTQYAPTLYTVLVNSKDDSRLFGFYQTMAAEIETYLMSKAGEAGYSIDTRPLVRFIVDEKMKSGKFDVVAELVTSNTINKLRREEAEYYGQPLDSVVDNDDLRQTIDKKRARDRHPSQDRPQRKRNRQPKAAPIIDIQPVAAPINVPLDASVDAPMDFSLDAPAPAPQADAPVQAGGFNVFEPIVPAQIDLNDPLASPSSPVQEQQPVLSPAPALQPAPQAADPLIQQAPLAATPAPQAPLAATPAPQAPIQGAQEGSSYASLYEEKNGVEYPIDNDSAIVGRDDSSDISIEDSSISRQHAEIFLADDDQWYIEDLGSTNGTKLNGRKITTARLQDGDKITVGMTVLEFINGN